MKTNNSANKIDRNSNKKEVNVANADLKLISELSVKELKNASGAAGKRVGSTGCVPCFGAKIK